MRAEGMRHEWERMRGKRDVRHRTYLKLDLDYARFSKDRSLQPFKEHETRTIGILTEFQTSERVLKLRGRGRKTLPSGSVDGV